MAQRAGRPAITEVVDIRAQNGHNHNGDVPNDLADLLDGVQGTIECFFPGEER